MACGTTTRPTVIPFEISITFSKTYIHDAQFEKSCRASGAKRTNGVARRKGHNIVKHRGTSGARMTSRKASCCTCCRRRYVQCAPRASSSQSSMIHHMPHHSQLAPSRVYWFFFVCQTIPVISRCFLSLQISQFRLTSNAERCAEASGCGRVSPFVPLPRILSAFASTYP